MGQKKGEREKSWEMGNMNWQKGQGTERRGKQEVEEKEQVKFGKQERTCIKGKGARTGRNRKKLKEWSRSGKSREGTERNRAGKESKEAGMD